MCIIKSNSSPHQHWFYMGFKKEKTSIRCIYVYVSAYYTLHQSPRILALQWCACIFFQFPGQFRSNAMHDFLLLYETKRCGNIYARTLTPVRFHACLV